MLMADGYLTIPLAGFTENLNIWWQRPLCCNISHPLFVQEQASLSGHSGKNIANSYCCAGCEKQ
jgi:hypothetical protein